MQGSQGTARTRVHLGKPGHIQAPGTGLTGVPRRPRAGGVARQVPLPFSTVVQTEGGLGDVMQEPSGVQTSHAALSSGSGPPAGEARSQAPLAGPVVTPVGPEGGA